MWTGAALHTRRNLCDTRKNTLTLKFDEVSHQNNSNELVEAEIKMPKLFKFAWCDAGKELRMHFKRFELHHIIIRVESNFKVK